MNERPTATRMAADEGFTLIEVMVALLVFAILSTGIVAGATAIIQYTGDNRARITAANIASQDLDVVRAIADPFSVGSTDGYTSIDGRRYHVIRSVSWINSSGADVSCNSNANLFFLRVNVRVTWDDMMPGNQGVQDDTILAPTDGTTDSETGAIGVSVLDSNGQPVSGVTVTVSLATGSTGALPATQPKATTTEGCTYVNDLKPGAYTLKISKTGYIDPSQSAAPTQTVTVSAGSTQSAPFTYAQAATFMTTYGYGPVKYSGSAALASNLPTAFLTNSAVSTTAAPSTSVARYPISSGYAVIVGSTDPTQCASVDPAAWPAELVNGVQLAQGVRASAAAGAGGTASVTIPMGVIRVRAVAGSTYTATQVTAQGVGNPGCSLAGTSLTWATKASGGWDDLQVPYGSWTVKASGTSLTASDEQVLTNAALPGVGLDGTVTLDPRAAK